MRRPLVIVGLLYAAGLVIADHIQPALLHLFALGLTLALLALAWPRARPWLLIPLIIVVAWTNFVSRTAIISPNMKQSQPMPDFMGGHRGNQQTVRSDLLALRAP